jgi:hypothetical protein
VGLSWQAFPNGQTTESPSVGDMLIYPVQPPDMPYGHVAIIVAVESSGHVPGNVRLSHGVRACVHGACDLT